MDYQEMINKAKQAVMAIDSTVTEDDLDNFWNGGVMEDQRVMFRHRTKDVLYMANINTMTGDSNAKKYLPALN